MSNTLDLLELQRYGAKEVHCSLLHVMTHGRSEQRSSLTKVYIYESLQTSVKINSVEFSTITADHPSPVPTPTRTTSRVLSGAVLIGRSGLQSSRFQVLGTMSHFFAD